ncbi:MAG: TIGR00269 family protein [Deltaproteobacteria bacterium]|nr:TIGR00269 family protein [Deltaproteobacteria bacterium]
MKCKKCGNKAVIKLRAHRIALCREDFLSFVLNRVQQTIKRYKLFVAKERVVVAVSGGKDSLTLFDILQRLGYPVEGFHIDLGIDGFSNRAREAVEVFFAKREAPLHIRFLREEVGAGMREIASQVRRPLCSLCGLMRRYIMNRFAWEKRFSALATGHNLDDEGAALLGNLMRWQIGYLARQAPVLPAIYPRLAKKAKPLALLSEREVLAYCILRAIEYHDEQCPYAKGATSRSNKEALNLLEYYSPGSKIRFYQEFLKHQGIFPDSASHDLRECSMCGFLTNRETCQFCEILEQYTGSPVPVRDSETGKG